MKTRDAWGKVRWERSDDLGIDQLIDAIDWWGQRVSTHDNYENCDYRFAISNEDGKVVMANHDPECRNCRGPR